MPVRRDQIAPQKDSKNLATRQKQPGSAGCDLPSSIYSIFALLNLFFRSSFRRSKVISYQEDTMRSCKRLQANTPG